MNQNSKNIVLETGIYVQIPIEKKMRHSSRKLIKLKGILYLHAFGKERKERKKERIQIIVF